MQFFFDESGDFSVPATSRQHAVGIVVGVDIPQSVSPQLDEQFDRFVANLSAGERKNSEPKGSLLTGESLRAFAEMMAGFDEVYVTTTLLDLTSLSGGNDHQAKDAIVRKLSETAAGCAHDSMKTQVLELANQARNLSVIQLLRLFSWANCVYSTLHRCITLRAGAEYNDDWNSIAFNVDPVQRKPGSREQQVFEKMLPAWMAAMSRDDPFMLIEELHTPDHPFVRRYDTNMGIDIGRLVRGNVFWPSSADSTGLQIADIAAMIVRKAAGNQQIVDIETLRTYGQLMTRSPLNPRHAVGCILLGGVSPTEIGNRYAGLMEAISEARR